MAETQLPDPKMDENLDRMLEAAPLPELSTAVYRKISGKLVDSLAPVTPMPSTRRLAGRIALVFVVFASGLIGLMGIAGLRTIVAWQAAGILGILAAGLVLLSLVLAWQVRPGSRQRIPAQLAWACFAVGFLTGAAMLFPWRGAEAFVSRGLPCLMTGSAIAIPGGIVFWLLCRSGVALSPVGFGGTLGAAAGLLGLTVLQFRCVHQDALHLLVWHGGALTLSIGVGMLIALIAERSRPEAPEE